EKNEPFIIASWSPAGPDHILNFYPRKVSISNDGTLRMFTEQTKNIKIGDDAPIVEKQLDTSEVEKVKELIEKNKYWKLNENLDSDSLDGSYSYITVNLTDQTKTVGGLNPIEPRFEEIFDYVFDLVGSNNWSEEIKEHILEMNPELK